MIKYSKNVHFKNKVNYKNVLLCFKKCIKKITYLIPTLILICLYILFVNIYFIQIYNILNDPFQILINVLNVLPLAIFFL